MSYINVLLSDINFISNVGILCDFSYICSELKSEINSYKIELDDNNHHKVVIKMNSYSEKKVSALFHELIRFLEFDYFSCYAKEKNKKYIKYIYITVLDNESGYYFEIRFE